MDTASNEWLRTIGENDQLWATHLERIPNMICIAYKHLRKLAKDGKVYGTMLQCKDIFELICKTPVIMALISLEGTQGYKDTDIYFDIIRACLETPMSMGDWNSLAGIMVKKQNEINLPENVYQIIKRTRRLYQERISNTAANVVNWRNNTIGHGVLKFEDDDTYKQELSCLLNLLREYFDGQKKYSIRGLYDNLYFLLDEKCLIGEYWSDEIKEGKVQLAFDGLKTSTANYLVNQNYKYYLFDAFYKTKRIVKYSSYVDGQSIVAPNPYFIEISNQMKMGKTIQKHIDSVFVKRDEEKILESLNSPAEYIEPQKLIEEIEQRMDCLSKGVITIFMERGTGKSALANRMNGLYHPDTLITEAFSRSYHVQNISLRGMSDFINSINFSFRHSYNTDDDLFGSKDELPAISLSDMNSPGKLADFLNTYHQIYQREYTMLFLDGIDELTPESSCIMSFLPSREMLDDGVFIILLSRFKDESTVGAQSKKYIQMAANVADSIIKIKRTSKFNVELLTEYIKRIDRSITSNNIDALILRSDYRFLYLKAILSVRESYPFDNSDETQFIRSFMDYTCSFYGINHRTKIEEIAVTIALFPDISLHDYKKYIACQEITYEFVGLLNNLLPLMTATHRNGDTYYSFADQAYNDYLISRYPQVVQTVIDRFYVSFAACLGVYLEDDGFRDFEEDQDFSSSELNADIVFFAKTLLGVWAKVPRQCMIADIQSSEKSILKLYTNLIMDQWAKFGIGAYLYDSLRDSICLSLYTALVNGTEDCVYTKWAEAIKNRIESSADDQESGILFTGDLFVEDIVLSRYFDEYLLDYLIGNLKNIKDPSRWYWILERKCSRTAADAMVSSDSLSDFVRYLEEYAPPLYYEEWFNLLLTCDIPDELKLQMTHKLEKPSNDNALDYDYYLKKHKDAIALLEDYSIPIKDDMSEDSDDGPLYTVFSKTSGFKLSGLLGEDNLQKLYAAFINRLNYEKEQGNFEDFISEFYYFNSHLLGDIFEQYYKDDWPEKVKEIIPCLIDIEGGEYSFATDVLANLMVKLAIYMEQQGRFTDEYDILIKMIDGIDGRSFLVNNTYPVHREKLLASSEWGTAESWYPTDNALYLLKLLDRLGLRKKLKVLIDAMEFSCSAVDQTMYKPQELVVAHELQKYRFLQVKKSLGYHSSFDNQIERQVQNKREFILDELKSISQDSPYAQIHFEIELLLDYAWQLGQWDLGIEECEIILNAVYGAKGQEYPDIVLQSAAVLKDKINRCKSLFLFMKGHSDTGTSKPELVCTYDDPKFSLFWCIKYIFENDDISANEKKKAIMNEIEIKLRCY